eukprot:TRINITY_DN5621_c0_g1_i1.p1 TRINITY_DN5621_c0_g1~~TRINITY_DN5621_c0_g1_i1.p1  ORF type:complete len:622 (+),score=107.31 TRINITY_DN5621_c0_g1_i1:53-1867(+)
MLQTFAFADSRPPILVRLNLPGFSSPEPFRLESAPPSMAGLACSVLEEIGGFSKEELEGVRNNLDRVPLTLLGELCAGQLVELASDAELEVFLATSESPRGPAIIEVRPRDAPLGPEVTVGSPGGGVLSSPARSPGGLQVSPKSAALHDAPSPSPGGALTNGAVPPAPSQFSPGLHSPAGVAGVQQHHVARLEQEQHQIQEQLRLQQQQLQQKQLQLQQQQQLQQQLQPAMSSSPSAQRCASREPAQPDSNWAVSDSRPSQALAGPRTTLQHSNSSPALVNGSESQTSGRKSQPLNRSPQQKGSRTQTPNGQRRPRQQGAGEAPVRTASNGASSRQSSAGRDREPVHIRLYQEKDDRRRRLEEARLRRLEQEEEDLRRSAHNALGRQPSPGRAQSRSREPSPGPDGSAASFRARGDQSFTSPARTKPPLPERPASSSRRRASESKAAPSGAGRSTGSRKSLVAEPQAAVTAPCVPAPVAMYTGDASSVASDSGAAGLQSLASESLCGDTAEPDEDVQSLRQLVASQQQRIEFLENMHQQALRQVRKSREELTQAQQMRFREADKVLGLEQLISEMQVHRFDGAGHMQVRWEDWLRRARVILERD